MVGMPVKEYVAVHLDMGQRGGVVGTRPAIAGVGYQQVGPRGILPSELPEGLLLAVTWSLWSTMRK